MLTAEPLRAVKMHADRRTTIILIVQASTNLFLHNNVVL